MENPIPLSTETLVFFRKEKIHWRLTENWHVLAIKNLYVFYLWIRDQYAVCCLKCMELTLKGPVFRFTVIPQTATKIPIERTETQLPPSFKSGKYLPWNSDFARRIYQGKTHLDK